METKHTPGPEQENLTAKLEAGRDMLSALETIASGKVPQRPWSSLVVDIEDFAKAAIAAAKAAGIEMRPTKSIVREAARSL